jgi:hypothetical protein
MKNKVLAIVILVLFTGLVVFVFLIYMNRNSTSKKTNTINSANNIIDNGASGNEVQKSPVQNFDQCAAAGYTIEESYPKVCKTPDGKTFTEDLGNELDKNDLIRISSPRPNETVLSPLKITGEARGFWFNEGEFPVKIYDENGKQLGVGSAHNKSDWMTDDFVPFEATITYTLPDTEKGTLILEKDNPSDIKANDDSLKVPVVFGSTLPKQKVSLYYYDETKDKDSGGKVLCSKQGLVPVERSVEKKDTIIQDTINLLIQGKLTDAEIKTGIDTEYPLSGFALESALLEKGVLSLTFNDPGNETRGGSCRTSVLKAQIIETAKQFAEVKSVVIEPYNLFQP